MSSFFISEEPAVEGDPLGESVLVAGGELDYEASPQLQRQLLEKITPSTRRLVLDLALATFIDSTAIGVLAGALARSRSCAPTRTCCGSSRSPALRPC
jgi:anti-anti-sigma factor